jgi:hypothetical protein
VHLVGFYSILPHCRPWIDINNRRASGQCLGTVEQIDHPPPQCYYSVSQPSLFLTLSLSSPSIKEISTAKMKWWSLSVHCYRVSSPRTSTYRASGLWMIHQTRYATLLICADAAPRRWVFWISRLQTRLSEVGNRQDHQYYSISHPQNLSLIHSSPSRVTRFPSVLIYPSKQILTLSSYFDVSIINLICYF